MAIGIHVRLQAKQGQEAALEAVLKELAASVCAHEAGALFYTPFRTQRTGEYVIIERWTDQAALDAHRAAGHTEPFRLRFATALERPAELCQFEEIEPA